MSRKEQSNKKKLSPLTNHKNTKNGTIKGSFDRVNLFKQAAEEEKEKKEEKIFKDRQSNPWNRIYHSWFIRPFYSNTDYLCSTCILYGSDCFE